MAKVSGKVLPRPTTKKNGNALHVLAAAVILSVLGFGIFTAIHSSLFRLKNINVEAISSGYPLTSEQVIQMAKVSLGKQSLFDLNLLPIEARLLKHPWVKGVVIGKEFPDTVSLKIVERTPIALVNEPHGKVVYLEFDGTMFEDQAIVYSKDLPILQGFAVHDEQTMKKVRTLLFDWFQESHFPGVKISSLSLDEKLGLRAVIAYPLKNGQYMRPVIELGLNVDEALMIAQPSFKKVLEYLSAKSLPASKIWLGDGKKIVVKMARGP
jgi:hypothetical protein